MSGMTSYARGKATRRLPPQWSPLGMSGMTRFDKDQAHKTKSSRNGAPSGSAG